MKTLELCLVCSSLFVALSGCSTKPTNTSPCGGDAPLSGCGDRCGAATPCPTGLYCTSGERCGADCNWAAQTGCGEGQVCTVTGECASLVTDASVNPDAMTAFDAGMEDRVCADITLTTNRTTPNVMLIIDRSSSMGASFGGGTRWSVLRDSLTDETDGLIYSLQHSVRFGVAMYSNGDATCPSLLTIAPALDNYEAINTLYQASEIDHGTPTGEAITAVLADSTLSMATTDPTIFVLATDGAPYSCSGAGGKAASVTAVENAFAAGVKTYVIGVGSDVDLDDDHLTDLANAGLGTTSGPDEMFWRVNDEAGLVDALSAIVNGTISCDIALTSGSINTSSPDIYCNGSNVALNGTSLPCNDPNGWVPIDETHIRLQGTACDELTMSGGSVTATFPCGVVLF